MKTTANIVTDYLDFLENQCSISVSIHFDENTPFILPDATYAALLRYNSHKNPYCMVVKKSLHSGCIQTQNQLYSACESNGFCHICHAGVLQYIYPLTYDNTTIGFAAVSGFRPPEHSSIIDVRLWQEFLSESKPPYALYDKVLTPLNILINKLFSEEATVKNDEYIAILRYLNEYHADVHLDDLCKHFGRSRSHISHLFKKRSGESILEFCNRLRLEDARRLLFISDRTITEIAYDVGFRDSSYFIRCFKEKYGVSPFQYRKQQHTQQKTRALQ